jgi:hypothetical protein
MPSMIVTNGILGAFQNFIGAAHMTLHIKIPFNTLNKSNSGKPWFTL